MRNLLLVIIVAFCATRLHAFDTKKIISEELIFTTANSYYVSAVNTLINGFVASFKEDPLTLLKSKYSFVESDQEFSGTIECYDNGALFYHDCKIKIPEFIGEGSLFVRIPRKISKKIQGKAVAYNIKRKVDNSNAVIEGQMTVISDMELIELELDLIAKTYAIEDILRGKKDFLVGKIRLAN